MDGVAQMPAGYDRQLDVLRGYAHHGESPSLHPGLRKLYFRLSGPAFLDVALRSADTLPLFAAFVAEVFALCTDLPPLLLSSEDELLALANPRASTPPSDA
ncbi:hypothetical protein BV20DRAFT_959718 [Pilatotrama ljubarskyi]|nr:hypothetical protein BV20DRAFT_959718 [Pilatotrama ljubarskyi]